MKVRDVIKLVEFDGWRLVATKALKSVLAQAGLKGKQQ
jgi:hypothetical protein